LKQVLQNLSTGKSELVTAPPPQCKSGSVLIDTRASLISTGTERMLVDFGRAGILSKIRKQPDKVRQVLDKARTDGILTTLDAVRAKLGQPIALGYCNVGVVRESLAEGFKVGDRVASNGPHADVVCVPKNLCAKIPDTVSDETAAFTVVASIGLQGIRLAAPTLGEHFVVTGCGLIGLLTVQLLRAHGARVLALDYDSSKLALAAGYGAEICDLSKGKDPVAAGLRFSRGAGVDGVIITASTTSSDPVTQAAQMSRQRGRIVLVGVTGLQLNRADFYEKELSFQVSCSYGPGRYDDSYEMKGQDYPIGFVRWTEQRNFEAVLDMMADGKLDVAQLISHRFPFENASAAYDVLTTSKQALGMLLEYDHAIDPRHTKTVKLANSDVMPEPSGRLSIGVIGAGNYASRVLIPAFKAAGAQLHSIASSGGTSSVVHGQKQGFAEATSDVAAMLVQDAINAIVIATRHDSHASLVGQALAAGKHVFVEKPLALTLEDIAVLENAHKASACHLMVGFNRRFSPQVQTMKRLLLSVSGPKTFMSVMNAGEIPEDHWTQDATMGGGRIIGEACHHIDLLRFLADSPINSVQARRIFDPSTSQTTEDKAVIVLGFEDGSFGTIHYLANGAGSFPKERVEVFCAGRVLQLDNFIKLKGFNWPGFNRQNLWRQDKGQKKCAAAFVAAVQEGTKAPIAAEELFEVARATIEAATLLRGQTS
jgi:predicted dehydrogenase/threonine dehydrogenase-like Zn-dependent dehydrogenase